jgi:hypothetical protein
MKNISIEVLVKENNEDYFDFVDSVNDRLSMYTGEIEVLSIDFLNVNKDLIAIIKYNVLEM